MIKLAGQPCAYCDNMATRSYFSPIAAKNVLYCDACHPTAIVSLGDWRVGEKTLQRVEQILESGRLSYGPYCREFESQIARAHASNHGVVSNSGTSSLQVALQTLKEVHGWQDGDEVLVPASTFVATVNIVIHNRLKPVLIDVEDRYYAMDPTHIERAITGRTRCIIPVHPYGQPADMLAIMEIADQHDLKVIEDSCEAMFVDQAGGMVGSSGDIGIFSTYMAHLITTGVGGVAVTDSDEYAEVMRSLVNHGRSPRYLSIDDDDQDSDLELLQARFRFERVGHSFRITELEAALALEQLDNRHSWLKTRQVIASAYTQTITEGGLRDLYQVPQVRPNCGHAFMVYPIVWLGDGDKWHLIRQLERCGIETREALPIINQPVYAGLFEPAQYPVAQWLVERGFYIGCHQHLTPEHICRVQEVLREFAHR